MCQFVNGEDWRFNILKKFPQYLLCYNLEGVDGLLDLRNVTFKRGIIHQLSVKCFFSFYEINKML